jgi:hypothetical protein
MTEAALDTEELVLIENASKPEEVLDTRSPAEIEAELMKKAENAAIEAISAQAPEVVATQFFKMVYPMYQARIHSLMARDAKQVLDALVSWPLENEHVTFRSQAVESVFSLGTRLLDAKFIILQAAQMDEKIALDKKSETSDTNTAAVENVLATVETNFTQGEQVNG